jgi:carboxyl-terminal processing protease
MIRRATLISTAAVLAAVAGLALRSSAQDASEKVVKILDRLEEPGADVWAGSRDLAALGRGALDEMRKGLTRANPFPRIAVGKVLYEFDFKEEALEVLGKVLSGSKTPAARKVAADVATSLAGTDKKLPAKERRAIADSFKAQAAEVEDDIVKVALWRGHWLLTEGIEPKRAIRELLGKKDQARDVKDEAALALAEMDAFLWAKEHLKTLALDAGEKGRLARAYLRINTLTDEMSRPKEGGSKYALLDEIIEKLRTFYHDPAKIDENKLIEAGARGMLGSLDPYTMYLDEAAIKQLKEEDLQGHYGGIGARVAMRKNKEGVSWLTITEPIFSGPAYRAGLRSHDIIADVEGTSTANKEVSDMVRILRGKPGTDVKIKVFRRGWTKEKEYVIKREEVQLETTMARMLPGQIGYIKYTTFGDLDDDLKLKGHNVETYLKDMMDQGMKALILDLRNNSGGYLRTAKRIAGLFLPKDTLLTTTREAGREKDVYKAEGNKVYDGPMVVLTDDGSASASEILSGALRDHGRALLVGEKTFGKGSVQDLKYLKTFDEKAAARITIAKWFLPKGASVEADDPKNSGIKPDLEVKLPERDLWKDAEFDKLRADGKVEEYVTKNFGQNRDLFRQLAETDLGDPSKYPGFDSLFDSLGTRLSKGEVRELLRDYVRNKVQDDQGKALNLDFQTDVQLQAAIRESAKKAQIDVKGIKEYEAFASSR